MFYTYILESSAGKFYIGQTNSLSDRLLRHNSGRSRFTAGKGPWKLIYKKEFSTRAGAMDFEKYLKSIKSKGYIKSLILSS